ncbi:MAG: hypothetical protein JWL72_1205 [Ilumatobacteraceae bacterium]|nr:hypothetical protein [Ilumatobacteraceae bacterium]
MVADACSDLVVGSDPPCPRGRTDSGFGLVEIIMAVVIMSIVIVPTLNAVITAVRAGTTNTDLAEVQTVLQNAADRVNRVTPKTCDYTIYAQAAAQTEGWLPSTTTVVQKYYTPGATAAVPGTWTAGAAPYPACPGASVTPLLVQMVTITVRSPDGKVTKTVQVVKSDV